MGFTPEGVVTVDNTLLENLPVGDEIVVIPMFRPEDYMYHTQCDYPENMVNDLGVVANMGNYFRLMKAFEKVRRTRQLQILALGGSITAGGYYMDFVRQLQEKQGLNVTVHNHGHGATELTCKYFILIFIYLFLLF